MRAWALAAGIVCAASAASVAHAHPLGFGVVELTESRGGEVSVALRVSGTEQQGHRVTMPPPQGCATQGPTREEPLPEGFAMRARWSCVSGLRGARVSLSGLEGSGAQFAVRARFADGVTVEETLDDARRAVTLPTRAHPWSVAWRYFVMGARHIAEGADHLAFVLALALWFTSLRALALAVTGFTLGHSVTLALAALGWLRVPQRPVEACIALSVLLVALDVAKGRAPPERGWMVTGAIGALHGLGFAGALREAGLPAGAVVPALAAFNVGVEVGQVLFIALALGAMALLKRARVDERVTRRWVTDALGAWSVMLLLQRVW